MTEIKEERKILREGSFYNACNVGQEWQWSQGVMFTSYLCHVRGVTGATSRSI